MGLFNLGSLDLAAALGRAPAGLYSGLDPSASIGAWGNSPLGGGLADQVAAAGSPISSSASGGINPLAMMMIQQALSGSRQQSPQQEMQFGGYAQPQAVLAQGPAMPAMNSQIGRMLMGGA